MAEQPNQPWQSARGVELSDAQRSDHARARRSALWVGVIMPLALVFMALALQLAWLPRVPNPAAMHWGGNGQPDGFGSPLGNVLMFTGTSVFVALLVGLMSIYAPNKNPVLVWSSTNRFMAAFSLCMTTFIVGLGLTSTITQLDLEDAADGGNIGPGMLVSLALGIALGLGGYALQPRVRIDTLTQSAAEPLKLAQTERAVWVGAVRPSKVYVGITVGTAVLMLGVLLLIWVPVWTNTVDAADRIPVMITGWVIAAVAVAIVAMLALFAKFLVRIDENGIEVRGSFGWPVFRVPAEQIIGAAASEVNPMAEFGGWGVRVMPGRFGVVMRTGEGIVVQRTGDRIFAVTVGDAETGAALLNAVARAER